MAICPPGPLGDEHQLDDFRCTSPELTRWLVNRARKNHRDGASRCFVVCDDRQHVIGYYALAAGAVSHEAVPGHLKRNMPDPIPIAVLGRLAVHADWTGKGMGQGLLQDALRRTLQIAQQMGLRALLCHAIDEPAKAFYLKHGFIETPLDPMTVMLSLTRLGDMLGKE